MLQNLNLNCKLELKITKWTAPLCAIRYCSIFYFLAISMW